MNRYDVLGEPVQVPLSTTMLVSLGEALIRAVDASARLGHMRVAFTLETYVVDGGGTSYPPLDDKDACRAVVREAFLGEFSPAEIKARHPWMQEIIDSGWMTGRPAEERVAAELHTGGDAA